MSAKFGRCLSKTGIDTDLSVTHTHTNTHTYAQKSCVCKRADTGSKEDLMQTVLISFDCQQENHTDTVACILSQLFPFAVFSLRFTPMSIRDKQLIFVTHMKCDVYFNE